MANTALCFQARRSWASSQCVLVSPGQSDENLNSSTALQCRPDLGRLEAGGTWASFPNSSLRRLSGLFFFDVWIRASLTHCFPSASCFANPCPAFIYCFIATCHHHHRTLSDDAEKLKRHALSHKTRQDSNPGPVVSSQQGCWGSQQSWLTAK